MSSPSSIHPAARRRFARLAVIDDHPQFLASVAASLRDEGFDVLCTATNLPDALTEIRSRPVDAVIVDLTLNGCDGARVAEVVQWISPRAAVVLHSPFLDGTMTATARELGYHVARKVDGIDGLLRVLCLVLPAAAAIA